MTTSNRSRGRPGTLIALHGHGDDASGTLAWARAIAPRHWRVEAVPSPPAHVGRSWFETGPRGADPTGVRRSVDLVVEAAAAAGETGPVVVVGFSQGAAIAFSLPELPGLEAVVGICGFLPETDEVDPTDGPPALLIGATGDDVTPAFLAHDAAALMSQGGRDGTFVAVPGGHVVGDRAVRLARRWIADRVVPRLRLSVGLPTDRVDAGTEFVSGEGIAELAAHWEHIGLDAAFVTDHPAPDDRWLAAGGHHALEPTVALAAAATATTELLLHTHVYVLGYRNPFLAAKALASLDVISDGRLILGVAAGYLRPEFEALGADHANRGERLEESLSLLRRIWSGESVSASGPGFTARSTTVLPVPAQSPRPPIWVGGNSIAAMKRAITHGEGWSPFPTPAGLDRATRTAAIPDVATLEARLVIFRDLCEEAGPPRYPTVCFGPFSLGAYLADPDEGLAALVEEAEQLFGLGVDWLALSVPGGTRAEKMERAQELHDSISAPIDSRPARAERL